VDLATDDEPITPVHWSDLGDTAPDNLVLLLCWFHHHRLHEQHWRLEPPRGRAVRAAVSSGEHQRFSPPRLDIITRPDQLLLVP
jgi:hypothetical protein